jgi:putative Holliday junction resolvase
MSVILALDLGTAHTGIAISQEGILATPLATIFERDINQLVGRLTPYIAQYDPEKIVLGVPTHGHLIDYGKLVADKLQKIYPGEIVFFSEDLSSRKAHGIMKEVGKTLIKKKKEEHQTAAAVILQEYLESI